MSFSPLNKNTACRAWIVSRLTLLFLPGFCAFKSSYAQTVWVKGIVENTTGVPLQGANAVLYYPGHTDSLRTITNHEGEVFFREVSRRKAEIAISYIGYETYTRKLDLTAAVDSHRLAPIRMVPGSKLLENISLESSKVQIKEDTVSFLVDSTMYRRNDNVEELLKKLPGITVDKAGTVTAQGKEVTKVKVNGKEFFGGDVRTATRELNADMVDRIQVIDDYGDQSAFTGVKDGDPTKTLNIELKKDRNKGYFGNISAGAGTDERYATSISLNRFNDDQQISLIGNWNNTNSSSFNFGSLGGTMGNLVSSMARGMGIGQGGGGVAATLGNFGINDGTGPSRSIGLNYRDSWSKKVSAYGSYSLSDKRITTIRDISQQVTDKTYPNTNEQQTNDYTVTTNHRFSFNIEYALDSFNFLKINPTISHRRSDSRYASDYEYFNTGGNRINTGSILEAADSKAPNVAATVLWNHRFHKKGRSISFNLNGGHSSTKGTDDFVNRNIYYLPLGILDSTNHQFIPQENENRNYGARVSYTEPLSRKKSIEINYSINYQYTDNEREVFIVDSLDKARSDSLSNVYDNTYVTNRLGFNYRVNEKKYNYTAGIAVQSGTIKSNSLQAARNYRQNLLNFFPVVRFAYNFSRSRSFNLNYNGFTNQPSYTQLNPVADNSNSQNVIIGNPDLRPEFTNTFSTRYNNFDFISGNVFFSSILFSFTRDKIVSDILPLGPTGRQETRYLNANGFYTITGFYNISRPRQNRKYVLNWGGNIIYNNNISYNRGERNTGRNWILGQRLSEDIKVKKWLETTFAANYSLNKTNYSGSVSGLQNLTVNTWSLSHSARIFFSDDFIWTYEIDKTINSGYTGNVNANLLIINSTLEKQFLKKKNLSLKLQAYDILDENKGLSRAVTGVTITDTRTNRLARYFLLTAILRINKFRSEQQLPGGMMMPGGTIPGPGMRPF